MRSWPGFSKWRFFKLYLVQAVIGWLVLLALGFSIFLIQWFILSSGRQTNAEVVLQQESINYIINNRTTLLDRYPELYQQVAQNLAGVHDEAVIAVLIMK
jgi:hypothetical protein